MLFHTFTAIIIIVHTPITGLSLCENFLFKRGSLGPVIAQKRQENPLNSLQIARALTVPERHR